MLQLIYIGVGGFLGACARFGVTKIFVLYKDFPFGTLISNIVAGFLIGLIIAAERHSIEFSPNTKLFLTSGFLGGLSTFSTFSLETVMFIEKGKFLTAALNVLLNNILCFAAVFLGFITVKYLSAK